MNGLDPLGAAIGLAAGCALLLVLAALTGQPRAARAATPGGLTRLARSTGAPLGSLPALVAVSAAAAFVGGTVALAITAVPAVALLAAIGAGCAPVVLLRRRTSQRRRQAAAAWPDAVDMLASAVRAGLSLGEALSDLGRMGPEPLRGSFCSFAASYRATGSFAGAVDELQGRLADPTADRVLCALRLAREFGGTDLGVVLRSLSAMLRQDARVRGEIASRQSWTVTAARLAVAAPWLTLALLSTRPEGAQAYASRGGVVVVLAAAILSATAYWLMLRIGRLPDVERLTA